MIAHLEGALLVQEEQYIVLVVSGVGYAVHVSKDTLTSLPEVGESVALWTHLAVRENALDLYGFSSPVDRDFFEQLISISGIGPKSALAILDVAPVPTLQAAIRSGDSSYLTKVSGVGKKNSQKIILELREKLEDMPSANKEVARTDTDVLEALTALGYTARDAREALKHIPQDIGGASERIKAALSALGSPKN
jgi:holliday junction DNA helicase RuvA